MTAMYQISKTGTTPTDYPVTVAEAKAQLNVSHSDDDTYITSLIKMAWDYAERVTGRSLITRSWKLVTDFPDGYGPSAAFALPVSPVVGVTSVTYYDTDGDAQTTAAYLLQDGDEAHIWPSAGAVWPDTDVNRRLPVAVVFTAGYDGTADSPVSLDEIPDSITQAMLLHIAHMYENREAVNVGTNSVKPVTVPMGYDALTAPYVVRTF
jgi:uncharacterized phiE125 gp8 family phage protein